MNALYRNRNKPLLQEILAQSFPLAMTRFKRSYYGLIQLLMHEHLVPLDMAFSVPPASGRTQMAQSLLSDGLVTFKCLRYSQDTPLVQRQEINRSRWSDWTLNPPMHQIAVLKTWNTFSYLLFKTACKIWGWDLQQGSLLSGYRYVLL